MFLPKVLYLFLIPPGEECIVALTDQWYLSYGEEQWKGVVQKHIHSEQFTTYNGAILEAFGEWCLVVFLAAFKKILKVYPIIVYFCGLLLSW